MNTKKAIASILLTSTLVAPTAFAAGGKKSNPAPADQETIEQTESSSSSSLLDSFLDLFGF